MENLEDYLQQIDSNLEGIKESIGSISSFVIVLIVVLFFRGVFDAKDKIIDYRRECQDISVSEQECKSWDFAKETYYVNKYTQQVMFDGVYGPIPYTQCNVVDNKNWTCNDGRLNANKGVITENYFDGEKPVFAIQHLTWLNYWWGKALSWVGK